MCLNKENLVNKLELPPIEMKVFAEKLGYEQRKFMNFLKKCRFHGNQWTSILALYLQMLVLATAIIGQILCLYRKVHNLPEIWSYAAGLCILGNYTCS